MKKITFGALLVVAFWTCSCSIRTSAVRLAGEEFRPPADPASVRVYLSEKDVPGEFFKIALVYAEEGTYFGSPSVGKLVDRLKMKAAEIGANGLILGGMEKQLGISGGDDEQASLSEKKLVKGVAILIKL
jgi:hypothetical protein